MFFHFGPDFRLSVNKRTKFISDQHTKLVTPKWHKLSRKRLQYLNNDRYSLHVDGNCGGLSWLNWINTTWKIKKNQSHITVINTAVSDLRKNVRGSDIIL